jgi:hypothetical protein
MFDIFETVGLDPVVMSGEENDQGAGHGRIQIVRRGKEARNEPQEIGEEDEESQGTDQRQEFSAPGPDDILQEFQDHLREELEKIPQGQPVGGDDRLSRGMQSHFAKGQIRQEGEHREHYDGH